MGGYRPRPLAILLLSGLDANALSSHVVDYVLSERATNVVLGLPLHKNGTGSEQSDITRTSKEAASRIAAEAMARNQRIPSASDLEADAGRQRRLHHIGGPLQGIG